MSSNDSKKKTKEKVEIKEEVPIGLSNAVIYGVGCGIGASIFILLGTAINTAGPGVLISLGLGGFLIFLTALNYSELSTSLPLSGGAYNFSKEGLGGFLAYIIGFFLWMANIGTAVFSALSFSLIINQLFPFFNSFSLIIALVSILFISIVVYRTQELAIKSLIILTVILLGIFVFFSFSGLFIAPVTNADNFNLDFIQSGYQIFPIIQMFSLLFISYTSITSNLVYLNPILKNRSKNIPRVNMFSITITSIIYLMVTSVVLLNIGEGSVMSEESPILLAKVLDDILGPLGFYLMVGAAVISTLIAMNAALGSATSVLHALARDNYITDKLQKVNKKRNVPVYTLTSTTIIVLVITIFVNIDLVAEMTSFIYFFGLAFVNFAAVNLRYKRKELDRPFKAPFFPYLPIIVGASCLILSFFLSVISILLGLMIFVIGFVYYLLTIADRHSIVLITAGIKFFGIIMLGILVWIINNFALVNSILIGGADLFHLILMRILIFFGIIGILTVIFDLIPLREIIYFFVKKIDKDKVAISIGEGLIIELKRNQIKFIYYTNLILGLIQILGSLFIFIFSIFIGTNLFDIQQISLVGALINQSSSEFIFITALIIYGLSLLFGGIEIIYYNKDLKS